MRHIVFFSSGIASWVAARRVVERYGTDSTTLVFADTGIEDPDNYRFLHEAASDVGAPLVFLKDGRTPWDVFKDDRFLGNTRLATCSKRLKQEVCRRYIDSLQGPITVYLGIDGMESHRIPAIQKGYEPYAVDFPLCWDPWLTRPDFFALAEARKLAPPRLYTLGFSHANCGGFCVKAGHSAFKHLLEVFPDRFKYHEKREEELRTYLDKNVSILRDRKGGDTKPMTLKTFRETRDIGQLSFEYEDWSTCGCFLGVEGEEPDA
jgi:hypothetical protein